MKTYDVTVKTDTTFEVQAENPQEAGQKAVEIAESHNGNYYDWEVIETEEAE